MVNTYRDMSKINDLAEQLIVELQKYADDLVRTIEYEDRDEVFDFLDRDLYAEDPDAAMNDAQDRMAAYHEANPDAANNPLNIHLIAVMSHIEWLKELTPDE